MTESAWWWTSEFPWWPRSPRARPKSWGLGERQPVVVVFKASALQVIPGPPA
ncbi:MAG: hypothetical protein K6T92_00195 [Candidatus Rokubacteria bacterium]|nr:hypothetical protein [Candidatus Rokubacteria bacterium]